jgi:hypothetical protein
VVTGVKYETREDVGNRFEIEQRFVRLQREKGERRVLEGEMEAAEER